MNEPERSAQRPSHATPRPSPLRYSIDRDAAGPSLSATYGTRLDEIRTSLSVQGQVERALVSESGLVLMAGWLADEGQGSGTFRIVGPDLDVAVPPDAIMRYARPDVGKSLRAFIHRQGLGTR